MKIATTRDLGATIRQRRLDLGLTQIELAEAANVSDRWLYQVENFRAPGAEINRVLRVVNALGLELHAVEP